MTSAACGGTADRIAARSLLKVRRDDSGIPAKYSSTFLGAILLFDAARRLREFAFFISAVPQRPDFKSIHQPGGPLFLSKEPDGLRLLNRRHFPELGQHPLGHDPIHMHHRDSFARSTWFHISHPASQREISNIDFVIAQDGAYFSNHAGDIAIAKVNQVALERSLHFNSIYVQQAWGILV